MELFGLLVKQKLVIVNLPQQQILIQRTPYRELGISEGKKDIIAYNPQFSHSVVADSLRTQRWQPTRLPCPWDSPGKNTGVGCHFLLQCMKVTVKLLSCVRLLATPWTAAYQTPPSMGFSRQEYWSGVESALGVCKAISQ